MARRTPTTHTTPKEDTMTTTTAQPTTGSEPCTCPAGYNLAANCPNCAANLALRAQGFEHGYRAPGSFAVCRSCGFTNNQHSPQCATQRPAHVFATTGYVLVARDGAELLGRLWDNLPDAEGFRAKLTDPTSWSVQQRTGWVLNVEPAL